MRTRVILSVLALAIPLASCSKKRETSEWMPSDHDRNDEKASQQPVGEPTEKPTAAPSAQAAGPNPTWAASCAPCHGLAGRGDGPLSRAVRARDLSDPAWQASTADTDIAEVVVKGRGKMPAFDLPATTVNDLVQTVRAFRRN